MEGICNHQGRIAQSRNLSFRRADGRTCSRLFKTKDCFDYLHAHGNEYLDARFKAAVGAFVSFESSTVVPEGFPCETLPKGTKIVDVGGVGSACHEIMRKNPLLKFTVQDLSNVAEQDISVRIPKLLTLERIY